MNKEQAKERLCAIETEVEKLRRIIDEPEQRTPEEGDVWQHENGYDCHICGNPHSSGLIAANLIDGRQWDAPSKDPLGESLGEFTYLGKFDEVFVKISDVREALSIGTPGETFLEGRGSPAYDASREALRKLNIIKD